MFEENIRINKPGIMTERELDAEIRGLKQLRMEYGDIKLSKAVKLLQQTKIGEYRNGV